MPKVRNVPLLAVGIWLLLVATNPGRNETVDVAIRQLVARQMWSARTVAVSTAMYGYTAWVPTAPGRWVAPYGIGQSLLFIPFDIAGAGLERFAPNSSAPAQGDGDSTASPSADTWRHRLAWLPIGLGLLPLLGVGYWLALRALLLEWGFVPPWPTLGSLALMLGTIAFHYAGQGQEETLIGVCLTLAVLFALRLRRRPVWGNALSAGLFAGVCILTRPVSVLSLLIIPVLIATVDGTWPARLRILATAGASCTLAACLALWYNFARFGSPFTFGYDRLGHFSKIALDGRSPKIFLSLLLGPGIGLLVLSPILLVAVYGTWRLWDRDRGYAVGVCLALLSCYTFFSSWHDSYTGGVAWGTRYQCHLLPLLAVPLTLGLQTLWGRPSTRRLAVGLLVLSTGIQALSVMATHQLECAQAACDAMDDAPFRNSIVRGQLPRRLENVALWSIGAPPPQADNPTCGPTITLIWDRYFPNFWGPVIARRLSHGAAYLITLWFLLLPASLVAIWTGIRREIYSARESVAAPQA
jgi:hypothetical protein